MGKLIREANLGNSDDFYAALLAAHEGLDKAEMARLNARLILTLANHIGDLEVLEEALAVARGSRTAAHDPTKA
ncbi:MAG: DUF2783 domain-containing protein [Pseudomonadota bacterium]